ncbi:Glycerophosphoryl diester phosphodiesterase [Candidatus Burkholderia verschuerenii]|uniref:Glycerophosphoryl diester phosphodiesterase n=1 Tax=Candidatus Burkholderia verschuerenii TaxID=242163 RepID=A0A0L0MFA1_9BURK|nr:glycerophosphodiester phosphodiesterase family protein [Candidatus Burkholderia verschuerenii]KND60624.1 Glycerophosphoryl diester phosphodiesterase [Candidatus Burkholderia verschuerenii]
MPPTLRTFIAVAALAAASTFAGCRAYSPARPMIVAHRGGTADFPENTLAAIRGALDNHADAIWLTVQLTRDGVPVLYRPADLSTNTNGRGAIADIDLAELQTLNAGWNFARNDADGAKRYPYRDRPMRVPTLVDALRAIPSSVPVFLDMKALPAVRQANAVARVLDEEGAWSRVLIYSTNAAYQQAFAAYPQARLFESRDATRARLANVALAHACIDPPPAGAWAAFEYARQMELTETFTLGEARSPVTATLWTSKAVACFRTQGKTHIMAIGVNDANDYRAAACLGIDALLVDSPRAMRLVTSAPLQCPSSAINTP